MMIYTLTLGETRIPLRKITLGEELVIERGGSPRPIDAYLTEEPDGLNWIKIGDAPIDGCRITSTKQKIKPSGLQKTRQVHIGDLILSNSMSFGRPYLMEIDGCIHDGWLSIKNSKGTFDITYLLYLLSSESIKKQYQSLAGAGVVTNLNKELVSQVIAYIPDLQTQNNIGTFFSILDDKISLNRKILLKLKNLQKYLSSNLFDDESQPGEYISLSDLGFFYSGLSGKSKGDFSDGNSKYITYMNVFQNTIATADGLGDIRIQPNEKQNEVINGDILFTQSSETPDEAGMTSLWTHSQRVYLNSFCFGFRLHNKEKVNPRYLVYALRSPSYRRKIKIEAQGISRYNLSANRIGQIVIKIPSKNFQEQVIRIYSTLDERINLVNKKIASLATLKKALMQKLFV